LEGGEIVSGSGNTVIFEIIPGSNDLLSGKETNIGNFTVHYRPPNDTFERIINYPCFGNYNRFDSINKDLRFATAVAMFGLKLRESKYFPADIDWNVIKNIAVAALTPDNFLETEFLALVDKAKEIYKEKKKRGFWKKEKD
jgi:Ca-activated chloride channel homolog